MTKKIKYSTKNSFLGPTRFRDTDLGIDIPAAEETIIKPGETIIVGTGLSFEFPVLNKIQRFMLKLLLGLDIEGVGTLVWPRGRSEHAVLSGVIDVGYRGEVKVKVFNPLPDRNIVFDRGEFIAQMVPVLALNIPLIKVKSINKNTDRGVSGGINK